MKQITLNLTDKMYHAISSQTKMVHHFIKQAIHEKLKSRTVGMKNFNELSQSPSYHFHFNGNGILISGKTILKKHGHAEIFGDNRTLELFNHHPISTVKPNSTYVVVGEDNQLNDVLIKPIHIQ